MASERNGTLYIGVTSDLARRVFQHKDSSVESFTKKYNIRDLVWYQDSSSVEGAIQREKQLKKWKRSWKIRLIEEMNPEWKDLSLDF